MIAELFQQFFFLLINSIRELGYFGIFIGMLIESTVIPLPSEIILIPAGVLVAKGEMSFIVVLLAGVFGSLCGAIINYTLALYLGRGAVNFLISKYGKIFFVDRKNIRRSEIFFRKHGSIATFIGRLTLGMRHLISIPAGFLRMSFSRFCLFTILGATVWSAILIYVGYLFGDKFLLMSNNLDILNIILILLCLISFLIYVLWNKHKK